jgi:hypothetical protein
MSSESSPLHSSVLSYFPYTAAWILPFQRKRSLRNFGSYLRDWNVLHLRESSHVFLIKSLLWTQQLRVDMPFSIKTHLGWLIPAQNLCCVSSMNWVCGLQVRIFDRLRGKVWRYHFKVKGALESMDRMPGTFAVPLCAAESNSDSIKSVERMKKEARVESINCLYGTRGVF